MTRDERLDEAKKIEMIHKILNDAKEMIALVCKPADKVFCHPYEDISDKKVREYYYQINEMCLELSSRNKMLWQKEEDENKG